MGMYLGTYKNEQERHTEEMVQSRHNLYQEIKNYHYRSLHNIMFVIGTGTFILSISFIGNIDTPLKWPMVLIASWLCLAGSIASKIYSNLLGERIAGRAQSLLENYIDSGYSLSGFNINNASDTDSQKWHETRREMDQNTLSLIGLGIAALIIFASVNLLSQNEIRKLKGTLHPTDIKSMEQASTTVS